MQVLATCVLLVILMAAFISGWWWPRDQRLFLLVTVVPAIVLSSMYLLRILRTREIAFGWSFSFGDADVGEGGDGTGVARSQWVKEKIFVRWLLGYLIASWLLGGIAASALFVFFYLRLAGRESWVMSVVSTLVTWGVLTYVFADVFQMRFPEGWVYQLFFS